MKKTIDYSTLQLLISNAFAKGKSSTQLIEEMEAMIANSRTDWFHRMCIRVDKYKGKALEAQDLQELISDYATMIEFEKPDEEIFSRIVNFYNAEINWILAREVNENLFNNRFIVNLSINSGKVGKAQEIHELIEDLDEIFLGHLFKKESTTGKLRELLDNYDITQAYNELKSTKNKK